jgi:hypothetical protein
MKSASSKKIREVKTTLHHFFWHERSIVTLPVAINYDRRRSLWQILFGVVFTSLQGIVALLSVFTGFYGNTGK